MERDKDMEWGLVEAAAKTVRVKVTDNGHDRLTAPPTQDLNEFADHRAGMDPIRTEVLDNGITEAREEAADFRNYIVWRILYRNDSPENTERLGNALGHVIAAYHLLSVVEESKDSH
jgi:hypothetical protein